MLARAHTQVDCHETLQSAEEEFESVQRALAAVSSTRVSAALSRLLSMMQQWAGGGGEGQQVACLVSLEAVAPAAHETAPAPDAQPVPPPCCRPVTVADIQQVIQGGEGDGQRVDAPGETRAESRDWAGGDGGEGEEVWDRWVQGGGEVGGCGSEVDKLISHLSPSPLLYT